MSYFCPDMTSGKKYNKAEDVLEQAINSPDIPRGPDPVWYAPIKNMDNVALQQVLSRLSQDDLKTALGWDGAAQWKWFIRTALGYAIWRRNIDAVNLLVNRFNVDVKQEVAQNESSCVHYDGGIRFTSLAYCVETGAHEPIALLIRAGASKEDWNPTALFNFPKPDMWASFWKSGGDEVTEALERHLPTRRVQRKKKKSVARYKNDSVQNNTMKSTHR